MAELLTGTPVFVPLTYLDGDTPPRLGFRLFSRNVRSFEVRTRPSGADRVEWTILFPGAPATRTTAPDGGLATDALTGVVSYPLTAEDLARIPLGGSVGFIIRVVNGDGIRRTYATGTLTRKRITP